MGDAKSDQPGPAGISLPRIVGLALRTYRQQFGRVATTAFVVFGAVATIDAVTVVLVVDRHVSRPAGAALTSVIGGVVAMVGVVIYPGVVRGPRHCDLHVLVTRRSRHHDRDRGVRSGLRRSRTN